VNLSGSVSADRWEGRTAAELCAEWQLPRALLFARTGSTNDVAKSLADAGAPPGTLVLADEQTAGRGRAGRSWISPPGVGLWFSVVLPQLPGEPGTLPLRLAAAVAAALDPWTQPDPIQVKWPNDLLLRGSKLAGILCEAVWSGSARASLVAGIGINLNQPHSAFASDRTGPATSLRVVRGEPVPRAEVARDVVRSILSRIVSGSEESDPWHRELALRDALKGRPVTVTEPESGRILLQGTALGIAQDGGLEVFSSGAIRNVRSGTVRIG